MMVSTTPEIPNDQLYLENYTPVYARQLTPQPNAFLLNRFHNNSKINTQSNHQARSQSCRKTKLQQNLETIRIELDPKYEHSQLLERRKTLRSSYARLLAGRGSLANLCTQSVLNSKCKSRSKESDWQPKFVRPCSKTKNLTAVSSDPVTFNKIDFSNNELLERFQIPLQKSFYSFVIGCQYNSANFSAKINSQISSRSQSTIAHESKDLETTDNYTSGKTPAYENTENFISTENARIPPLKRVQSCKMLPSHLNLKNRSSKKSFIYSQTNFDKNNNNLSNQKNNLPFISGISMKPKIMRPMPLVSDNEKPIVS